jgi:acid ceramidase
VAIIGLYLNNNNKKGAVITRDRKSAADVWRMGGADSGWFLVETNYDHWKKPLFVDDRATPAIKCMNQTGQKVVKTTGII